MTDTPKTPEVELSEGALKAAHEASQQYIVDNSKYADNNLIMPIAAWEASLKAAIAQDRKEREQERCRCNDAERPIYGAYCHLCGDLIKES